MLLNQITASFIFILSSDAWSAAKPTAKRIADSVQETGNSTCESGLSFTAGKGDTPTQNPARSPHKTTDREVRELWDKIALKWNEFVGEDGDKDPNRAHSDQVLKTLLGPVDGKTVLDIGCGNGYLSRQLSQAGASVIAIDLSPKMIKIAKGISTKRNCSKCSKIVFLNESGNNLSVDNGSVDHVVSNYVLMDCADLEANVASMYRVLKPGGTAVVVIVHPCFPLKQEEKNGRLAFIWENSYFVRHEQEIPPFDKIFSKPFLIFHRSLEEYEKVFREAGFEIKSTREPHAKDLGGKAVSVAFLLKKPMLRELEPIKLTAPTARTKPVTNIQISSQHGHIDNLGKRLVRSQVPALEWQLGSRNSRPMVWKEAREYASQHRDGWRLPEIEELWALYEQKEILGNDLDHTQYWSNTPSDLEDYLWEMDFKKGRAGRRSITGGRSVRCVRNVPVKPETTKGSPSK